MTWLAPSIPARCFSATLSRLRDMIQSNTIRTLTPCYLLSKQIPPPRPYSGSQVAHRTAASVYSADNASRRSCPSGAGMWRSFYLNSYSFCWCGASGGRRAWRLIVLASPAASSDWHVQKSSRRWRSPCRVSAVGRRWRHWVGPDQPDKPAVMQRSGQRRYQRDGRGS